ncbi:DUF6779 domain-containing protein [Corynebacterium mastitidis]|uniref:DUF6779 domain-containing protein n=1 Tax=Corynebacterium mastitidis TaxID=161890 RepID=A0ABU8NY40_9CORY
MSTPQSDRNPEPTPRRAASHGAGQRRHHGRGGDAGTDGGQILLAALVALALVASVVMQLTDSNAALKFALLAALWAAIIGFFLVNRYRRQAQRSTEQLAYEQRLHRSELREARAQAEAREAREAREPRAAAGGLSEEDVAILTEIRAGLDEVRSKLEDLQGHAFEYEPAALRAQAWRVQELEERADAVSERAPEKTGHIAGAPSVDAVAGRLGQADRGGDYPRSISPELADLLDGEGAHRGSHRSDAQPQAPATPMVRRATPSVEDTSEIAAVVPEPEREPEGRRGRRRADEHSGGLSVAELMANMKKDAR